MPICGESDKLCYIPRIGSYAIIFLMRLFIVTDIGKLPKLYLVEKQTCTFIRTSISVGKIKLLLK